MDYATIDDLIAYWKPLTEPEIASASVLLADASSKIRIRARKKGLDFDKMVSEDSDLAAIARSIVCKCVANAMKQADVMPFSQYAESAGGFSASGTFATAGGGLNISKNDWKELGLSRQMYGGVDIYGCTDKRDGYHPLWEDGDGQG